ncbi:hypothetical protein L210DRAFT_341335 [Boletus edulis BED1]|uniref:Uncharacterized protein n=1 Tax=Boletus edulis BED1 TaxID=1328754 RepID=A0AAD4GIK8_BOLED|nr:hypothetical protein L210DRAFT_341335 [Boletus edulis BED1]
MVHLQFVITVIVRNYLGACSTRPSLNANSGHARLGITPHSRLPETSPSSFSQCSAPLSCGTFLTMPIKTFPLACPPLSAPGFGIRMLPCMHLGRLELSSLCLSFYPFGISFASLGYHTLHAHLETCVDDADNLIPDPLPRAVSRTIGLQSEATAT